MAARLVLALAALFWALQEQQPPQQDTPAPPAPYIERQQKQFNFYPGGRLQVLARAAGNVRITGWQRSSVLVAAERIIHEQAPEKAKSLLDQYPIQVRYNQTAGTISTAGPPESFARMEINLALYVPKEKTDLSVQILKGDLAIGAINGWVEVDINEGSIETKSLAGYFSALTRKGDLRVEMSGKRWTGHSFTAATHRGSVALRLPADYSAALQLETRNGAITIQYPSQLSDGVSVPLEAKARKDARLLTASVGEGGAPIKLLTTAGDIQLTTTESR